MARKNHELARARAEARDAARRSRRERARTRHTAFEEAARARAHTDRSLLGRLDAWIAGDVAGQGSLALRRALPRLDRRELAAVRAIVARVQGVARRLATEDHLSTFATLATLPWHRPLERFRPRGKGRRAQLHSLVDHLLVRFAVPPFLYTALELPPDGAPWVAVFCHVASGGSLRSPGLPVPLSRRGCHLFLSTRVGWDVIEAARRAQVLAEGGDVRLADALATTRLGRTVADPVEEAFWHTAIAWFTRQPMLDPAQVGPLIDYLAHRREEDALPFSVKGRSVAALMRAMETWHAALQTRRRVVGVPLPASEIEGGSWTFKRREQTVVWRITEIGTLKELAAEGRAMRHCVLSYAPRIRRGIVSIWSLTRDDERMATVELHHGTRRIVQARGPRNRACTIGERQILARWAAAADLVLA